jgi:head-tail adaptor
VRDCARKAKRRPHALNAGRLDRLCTILANTQGRSASGSVIDSWEAIATLWCSKEDKAGSSGTGGGRDNATAMTIFVTRHYPGVMANMRLTCQGIEYEISHVAEVGRRDGLTITAKVRSA